MKKFLKATWKVLSVIMKITLLLLLVLILTPLGYFAWRAGQPMTMPEYDGMTYYELLTERRQAYDDLAQDYQAGHPNVDVKFGACFSTEIGVELMELPISFFYALASMYPSLQRSIDPRDIQNGYIPDAVTWMNIFPSTWTVFEKFVWGTVEHTPNGPVPYCRVPPP
jgi:hypothetical protein